MANSALYHQDFFAWTQTTAALLRAQHVSDLDFNALAEEIEALGKRDRRELGSQLQRLVMHLLKWCYEPAGRQTGHSWHDTIVGARDAIQDLLDDSPSLRGQCEALLQKHYPRARRDAHKETGLTLETFPLTCPWTLADILEPAFWPATPEERAEERAPENVRRFLTLDQPLQVVGIGPSPKTGRTRLCLQSASGTQQVYLTARDIPSPEKPALQVGDMVRVVGSNDRMVAVERQGDMAPFLLLVLPEEACES
ncbi:MAG: DUF29 domain-containing protein [Candidatus Tectimicrobiota bacterium]